MPDQTVLAADLDPPPGGFVDADQASGPALELQDVYKRQIQETGLDNFPETCPWTASEILNPEWLPD